MKTTFTTQHNAASTLNGSHAAHNVYSPLRRLTLLVTLLMTFALGARAADYVFYYKSGNTTYFLANTNNDNTPDAVTSFNPTTCIWEGDNGGKFSNNGRYLVGNNNNNTLTLTNSQNNGTNWTVNGNNLYFQSRRENAMITFYYYRGIRYNDGVWETVESDRVWNSWEAPNFDGNVDILYQVTTATVESKTQTELDPATSTVTLTPASTKLSSVGDRAEFQATAAAITQNTYTIPEHTKYTFNNTTYYQSGSTINTTEPTRNLTNSVVLNPTYHWDLSSGGDTYLDAGADGGTGWVQKKANPNADTEVIVSVWAVYGDNAYTTPTTTATITVMSEKYNPTGITAEPLMLEVGGTGSITYILEPTGAKDEITYSGYGNTIISIDANGAVTGLKAGITEVTLTAKKLDNSDDPSTKVQVTVTPKAPTIEFSLGANVTATISRTETGAKIYYTTDGTTPTTSSPEYTAPVSVTAGATVKAIVVVTASNGTKLISPVAEALANAESGIVGNTVFLYDLEDHNWTYYQQPSNLPSGYPTTYLSSPNPRNVKITYKGGGVSGASAVAISALEGEGQNEMVYYKTLEKSVPGMSGDYPYTVISNPFSKRPKVNSTYYGFNGWKVISGGEYILEYDNDGKIGLDETIHFTNLDNNYTPNCMSAEIVFEATWTQATVKTGNSAPSFDGGTYETNFWVLSGNPNNAITVPTNCTMTARYPDGSVSWDGNFTRAITAGGNNAKVEFVNMNSTENVSAANYTFTMGRGIVNSGNGGQLQGCTRNDDCEQTVKVESGTYSSLHHFTYTLSSSRKCNQFVILGCDYDRAKSDNNKLKITGAMYLANAKTINRASGVLFARSNIKSGTFQKTITGTYSGTAAQSYYFGCYGSSNRSAGHRYMLVEGGDIRGLCGGTDHTTNQQAGDPAFTLRIRGSENNPIINGIIYGAAENADCRGRRTMVLTGGTVKGWIAGGANGTESSGGTMTGTTFVYVGGKANINSSGSQTVINRAVGGNVFAAGCGNGTNSSSGQVTQGTNVVVADDAYVERGVYGGGSYGYTTNTSNIYITGGRIGGVAGGVNGTSYSANIPGGVYGGACQNQGGTVNIYMTGGEVNGGLYGGSNNSGTISNNVTMQINGGQVGTPSAPANIHGGGYGKDTKVNGNVTLTLGSNTTDPGVTVYGDVYGGSALGTVNDANSDKTEVTLNCGTINGSLYGGGLGNATEEANVNGAVTVTVNGGSVKKTSVEGSGGVYGANNINGEPKSSVTVVINGTAPAPSNEEYALYAVYGGGNQADYDYNGGPIVTVNNCENSIEYVYGGGNAAAVKATSVTIWGGNVIGNVFGGGHGYKDGAGADVEGGVNVAIKGGTIKKVFGGSNSKGNIGGTIELTIDKDGDCPMRIGEVYGGGNEAAGNAGTLTIGCTGALVEGDNGHVAHPEEIGKTLEGIGAVYGGANNANVTNDSGITLNINSGMVANAFGGNNTGGDITGGITVNINKNANTCGWYVGNVYGAGNLAQYSGSPAVNILNGEVSGNVYGGGKGDANDHSKGQVTGNPTVTIGDNANADHMAIVIGDVYGGGDAGNVEGIPVVNVVNKCNTTIGNVYGGGNAADVNGTDVNIDGGTITGMVFGGGHGDKNAEPQTEANVNGDVQVNITGGSINKVFGGSNSKGNITGTIALNIEKGDESCEMHITEVYGGGNEAAGNAGTITIGCTGGEGEGIGDVYGGANAADINTPITLNITGGNISRVFGGNNTSGSISDDIAVNVNWDTENPCGVNYLGNVYGAGNQAAYSGNTEVNILNGTVTGSVYGGGLGATAVVTGTTTVNIDGSAEGHSVAVTQNVLGGGDAAAVKGSTDVNIINGAISRSVFGGGNAAGVSENGVVDVTGGAIASGVYGGSNASGTVGNTIVTLTNGTIGATAAHANVHGGGYGKDTQVSGNVAVNIQGGTIYGDVYGGSALGTVNTNTSNTTAVNLEGGLVHGDAYGGGLGDSDTAADVNGNVTVTLNGTAFTLATMTDDEGNTIPTSGRVFGCNNINGSPKGTVLVKVQQTVAKNSDGTTKDKPTKDTDVYELQAVYGGGNLAAYNPTDTEADGQFTSYTYGGNPVAHDNKDKPLQVVIDGCDATSIEYVYGGGNAAATPATDVTVLGSYEIGSVFGGGNGKDRYTLDGGTTWNDNNGADVGIIDAAAYSSDKSQGKYGTGDAMTSVLGGTVHNIYGGSNTRGNIVGEATAYLDAASDCELNIDGIYGGGNEAYMDGNSGIQLGCITYLKEIYGGARNADVGGDINLTITSGHFDRVFGGNNLGGQVKGSITVNIEETGCNPITIGELYGCGNKAAYTTPGDRHPTINIRSFTSIGNVFGGGLGEEAVVTGNPTININVVKGANKDVEGWPYNDGRTIDFGDGSTVTLPVHEKGKIGAIGNVFGGGNAAAVIGNTQVNIGTATTVTFESLTGTEAERTKDVEGADIRGNVYGGGNQAKVTGKTNVVIGQ